MEVQGDRPGFRRRARTARAVVRGEHLTLPAAAAAGRPVTRTIALPTGTLRLAVKEAAWPLDTLCAFAARRNPKRGFLVVSRVLGRHWPAAPATMRHAARDLARRIPADLPGPVVVIGLAETAVGLGQTVHAELARDDALFLHSTRQQLDAPLLARFEEPHSHASAHLLYRPQPAGFERPRSVVLVDDEISTGTTLRNLAQVLVEAWPHIERLVVATLTDWSGGDWLADLPRPATCASLLSGTLDWHAAALDEPLAAPAGSLGRLTAHRNRGRLGWTSDEVDLPDLPAIAPGTPLRIIGTGEFTYPPFRLAEAMAARGHDVVVQATSRSPARLGDAMRHMLVFDDNYGTGVPNYLYNADPADGRANWVCHETPAVDPALLDALGATAIRWPT
jgi:adenine/guanine phosphoribosyltransferase-like PRPP-binding protein